MPLYRVPNGYAMNFFERQAQARRASIRLLILFGLAVAGIVLAVDAVLLLVLPASPKVLATASLTTLAIIVVGSMYRIASLRGGGASLATAMGGVPVPPESGDPALRRLRNVVEEMAIASGVPVPRIFVLEDDAAINAFAAGYSPADAVIAVTRGALQRLNRDELQGVVAHEFSHVLNGDMRLNIRLIGVLFGILMIGLIGRKILGHGRSGGRKPKGVSVVLLAAAVAMAIGYVGLFFARLIKAGVSRSREHLADASAVQFTRQTSGLAGALKKIAGLPEGSRLAQRSETEEVSHMLFGDGMGFRAGGMGRLFATHPPLLERIRALEPGFDDRRLRALTLEWATSPPDGLSEDLQLGLMRSGELPARGSMFALSPGHVSEQVGHPGADDYQRADAIVARLSDELRALASQRDAVMPLVLGLMLGGRGEAVAGQHDAIAAHLGPEIAARAMELHHLHLQALHPMLRLPLAALAFPTLRLRPKPELTRFLAAVAALGGADSEQTLFEYCLGRLLTVQLRDSLDPSRHVRFGRRRLPQLSREASTLLSVIAHAGHADAAQARRAFLAGMERLLPQAMTTYAPPTAGVPALDAVWEPLDALDPLAKQLLVEALTITISHDGRVTVAEAELLRTVCGVLHCPLPPVLESVGDLRSRVGR